MLRAFLSGGVLVALALLMTGCDSAKNKAAEAEAAAKKAAAAAKDAAGKAADSAKEAVEAAKTAIAKKFDEGMPKIQEKINGLSGDAKTKAQTQFDELKKTYEEAKASAPDKWESLKAKATEQFEELKKLVGLDK
jgi:hypothetical protein